MRLRLSPVADGKADRKKHVHGCKHGPAVPARAGHAAQGVRQACANHEDRQDLHEVRQGCRVLKGVGTVGVEETAAVGAQHFDRFLRCHGALPDGLRLGGLLERMDHSVRIEVLRNTLPYKQKAVDNAGRR